MTQWNQKYKIQIVDKMQQTCTVIDYDIGSVSACKEILRKRLKKGSLHRTFKTDDGLGIPIDKANHLRYFEIVKQE